MTNVARANDARITGERQITGRVIELTIATPAFVAPTRVHVNLPAGYDGDPSRRWPVTYFTAGTMNRYTAFNDVLGGEKLARDYPSIIVSPDANSGYWSDWYNGGAFGPPKYETFVIDQLIPLIDARFRTIADRSHRAIFGISMGGYGSMMFAARHPDLFVAAASLSGAVDSNLPANGAVLSASSTFDGAAPDAIYGPRATQEVRWHGHNPTDLAANLRGLDLQVRTANGVPNPALGEEAGADTASCIVEKGVQMASVNLHEELEALGIAHEWKDYGAGCHTVPNFQREVTDTLAVFERVLAAPPAPRARFNYASIERRFDVWGWTVKAHPGRALEFMRLTGAGAGGLTLSGSGRSTVTTAPLFRKLTAVDVETGTGRFQVAPDARGRLHFTVDLGAPHPDQQYTTEARVAGQDEPGYFRTRTVRFDPHARLLLGPTRGMRRARRGRPFRIRVRALGGRVRGVRIVVRDARGRRVGRSRRFSLGAKRKRVRVEVSRRLRPGRFRIVAVGRDTGGRRVRTVRRVRLRRRVRVAVNDAGSSGS